MKHRLSRGLDILVESVNYLLISYALSNMAMLFRTNWLYILFFASEVWLIQRYWSKIRELTASGLAAWLLVAACFAAQAAMFWWIGRVVGAVVPFRP